MKHQEKDPGVWLICIIAALMVSLFLTVTSASASSTMHLVDSYIDGDVKVCVYSTSDGRHWAEVERARGSNCPYTHIEY